MTAHIYQAAADANVPKVQGIGSSCAYPGHIDGDLKEEDFWNGELHPSVVAYGFSKRLQLVAHQVYSRKTGMKTQLPILTNQYGEHDTFQEYRSHVLSALIKRFADAKLNNEPFVLNCGSGRPIREFLYVDDTAEACFRLAVSDFEGRINIGNGIGISIRTLAERIAGHVGYTSEIRWDRSKPDGIYHKVNYVTKMKNILNYTPPTDLDSGLEKTIGWYMENKEIADARM